MRLVIVTGMSGAGKTAALKMLEDMGFYCVDNLPIQLVGKFAELISAGRGEHSRAALGIDIRSGESLEELGAVLKEWDQKGFSYEILFLDASDEVLIKRYKETRRSHPLSRRGSIEEGISKEREMLREVKAKATYIIDTSNVLTRELKEQINRIFQDNEKFESLVITVCSFGFKYGLPLEADLVFDVRFLPNPYYIPELKQQTGLDEPVRNFVFKYQQTLDFTAKVEDLLSFLLPNYLDEGKTDLVIAVGCTGGKHRSVCIAKELYEFVSKKGYAATLSHRDMGRR